VKRQFDLFGSLLKILFNKSFCSFGFCETVLDNGTLKKSNQMSSSLTAADHQEYVSTIRDSGQMFKRHVSSSMFKGVTYYDLDSLTCQPDVIRAAIAMLANRVESGKWKPTLVLAIESRGFSFGALLAHELGIGFKMIRKQGKTPGEVVTREYSVEYGGEKRCVELGVKSVTNGDRVLIVDDVLATGGTIAAVGSLVRQLGAQVAGYAFMIEIDTLRTANVDEPIVSLMVFAPNEPGGGGDAALTTIITPPWNKAICIMPDVRIPSKPPIVLYSPTMKLFAKYLSISRGWEFNDDHVIQWSSFPDGTPNIHFPGSKQIKNRRVVFVGSLTRTSSIMEQIMLCNVLPRQGIASLDIVFPYFSFGTMERVDREGDLATAETLATLMSCAMPLTRTGPPVLHVVDIHALPNRFYFGDQVRINLCSAVSGLFCSIVMDVRGAPDDDTANTIVFPDAGAYKRFASLFDRRQPMIVCSKVRNGDSRVVCIQERIFPNKTFMPRRAIIVDDIAQSGNTLYECMRVVRNEWPNVQVDAFVTHAVFPRQSYLDFLPGGSKQGFRRFYTTDSVPETTSILPFPFFQVVPLAPWIGVELFDGDDDNDNDKKRIDIEVMSVSKVKYEAVQHAFRLARPKNPFSVDCQKGVGSLVSEQPVGRDEIERGCRNRLNGHIHVSGHSYPHYVVAIENGLVETSSPPIWVDQACVMVRNVETNLVCVTWSDSIPVPVDAVESSRLAEFKVTAGTFINKDRSSDWSPPELPSRQLLLQQALYRAFLMV
jgi:adenine phosphoribosyltransferase